MEEIREIKNIIYELGKGADGKLISDLVIEIGKLRSGHKAAVETLEKDIEVSGKAVEDLIDLVDELKENEWTMQDTIEALEKVLESTKCCCNCGHGDLLNRGFDLNNCNLCKRSPGTDSKDLDIDNWTPKRVK